MWNDNMAWYVGADDDWWSWNTSRDDGRWWQDPWSWSGSDFAQPSTAQEHGNAQQLLYTQVRALRLDLESRYERKLSSHFRAPCFRG